MPADGAGSNRIVLVKRPWSQPPAPPSPARPLTEEPAQPSPARPLVEEPAQPGPARPLAEQPFASASGAGLGATPAPGVESFAAHRLDGAPVSGTAAQAARPRPMHPPRPPAAQKGSMGQSGSMRQTGWTPRRLTGAAALGAASTIAGGLVFLAKFGVFGEAQSPLLAVGFGLFTIGMIVFCASLIALLGIGLGTLAEERGWAPVAGFVAGPLAILWSLHLLGAVGYSVPAVVSLVLIGGLVAALR